MRNGERVRAQVSSEDEKLGGAYYRSAWGANVGYLILYVLNLIKPLA